MALDRSALLDLLASLSSSGREAMNRANAPPLSVTSLIRRISPVPGFTGSGKDSGAPPIRSASAIAMRTASIASAPVQVAAMCQPARIS